MQLTVREVSGLLQTTDASVVKWIKQRGLPAHQVNGQYRFNRAELLEWATVNQIKVSTELFNQFGDDEPVPSFAEALQAGGIVYGLKGGAKSEVMRALVEALPLLDGSDRDMLLQLFLAREAAASTAIGNGIALPHVRNPIVLYVARPLVTLCFLERPIEFGALDGQPVSVLFSLISPSTRAHLQILSKLSFALHDEHFRETVLRKSPADVILREARRAESALTTGGKAAS
jgi:PTS system nitrogen regulatory IIA component